MLRRFQREHLSTHAVSGWIPSLPLRVLYRTLYSQWRGTEPGAVATGSNIQPSAQRANIRTNAQKISTRALIDPCSKWLDPVATAPGSVPNALFAVAWYRTGSGSDRVKHSTFGTTRKHTHQCSED